MSTEQTNNMQRVFDLLAAEREFQIEKWGEQNHDPCGWLAILTEEVGEVARAILEGDRAGYRAELIQVGAVAVAALEYILRLEAAEKAMSDVLLSKEKEAA